MVLHTSGTTARPNGWPVVQVVDGSSNTIVGAPSGARNLISGNGSAGVAINGGSATVTSSRALHRNERQRLQPIPNQHASSCRVRRTRKSRNVAPATRSTASKSPAAAASGVWCRDTDGTNFGPRTMRAERAWTACSISGAPGVQSAAPKGAAKSLVRTSTRDRHL